MLNGFTKLFKGINGTYEINRVVGAFGGFAYVICANVFVGYEVFVKGREFDIINYCLAFPGGLSVIAGGTAAAIAWKDKAVASARVTEATGSKPAEPPEPAPQVQPDLVAATGKDNPKPDLEPANL